MKSIKDWLDIWHIDVNLPHANFIGMIQRDAYNQGVEDMRKGAEEIVHQMLHKTEEPLDNHLEADYEEKYETRDDLNYGE